MKTFDEFKKLNNKIKVIIENLDFLNNFMEKVCEEKKDFIMMGYLGNISVNLNLFTHDLSLFMLSNFSQEELRKLK